MSKRTDYDPYDHFMLRAPMLPVDFLKSIPSSPESLFPWLVEMWRNPLIREGLIISSLDFSQRLDREFSNARSENRDVGIHFSFLRYLCRFSSRCTPFGTFAGFSMGTIGDSLNMELKKGTLHELHSRPDMEYLMRIARYLECDPSVREKLSYRPNTSLYRVGSRWHFVEISIPEGKGGKIYDVVTIDDNGVIGDILEFCKGGRKLSEIRSYLLNDGWGDTEVTGFVESLVTAQVLVSGLEPVICGPEYIDHLIDQIASHTDHHDVLISLEKLKSLFDNMSKPLQVLEQLPRVDTLLAEIPVHSNRNHLIQVDMKLSSQAMIIDSRICGEVLLGLRIIKALSGNSGMDVMKNFRKAFSKRYGARKVQLVKVLDPETGIGLDGSGEGYWTDPVPWIDDLRWGPSFDKDAFTSDRGNEWLVAKYHQVIRTGKIYIDVESRDLQAIGIHNGDWPMQMTAMVELFQSGSSDQLNMHILVGSSGNPSYLLGRFGFADQDSTKMWIRQLVSDDISAYPEFLCAEVVHLPEDRTGNILQRPAFLDYEIPYLARSATSQEKQIPVTDLLISVENQQVVISSASTGKKIRPYMSNAYNHQLGNLAIYKFLHRTRLQEPNAGFGPNWGDAIRQSRFVPGIRFKNLILAAPVWLIRCEDIAHWIHPQNNIPDWTELIKWKNDQNMPDEMLWMSADQELYFAWDHPNLMLALWDAIKNLRYIRVRPFYLSAGTPVKSPDGSHANQFIFCFRKS